VGLLRAQSDELAKAWLVQLIAAAPLARAAQLPLAELATAGPRLCQLAAEALGSDDALERLRHEEVVANAGRLAGVVAPAEVPDAIEALRAVLWSATMEAMPRPSAALVSDLAQRLASICAVIASGTLAHGPTPVPQAWEGAPSARDLRGAPEPSASTSADAPADARRGDAALADGPRREAIERALARRAEDGAPFAALLVEVDGLDRLLLAESRSEVATTIESVEGAISAAVRAVDAVERGGLGRYWIVSPATERGAAHALALGLADAVGGAASHRGTPLTVSIGYVICPTDGEDAERLAERAEQRMFAARASGLALAPAGDEP
jgi:GGDEF domain-containing protein